MNTTRATSIMAAGAIAAAALVLAGSPAEAAHRSDPPLTVSVEGVGSWRVTESMASWNADDRGQPTLVLRANAPDADIEIVEVSRPQQWWLGNTIFLADGDVRIVLNTAPLDSSYLWQGNYAAAKGWTTTHELGHAFGLAHSDDPRSTMCYDNNWHDGGTPSFVDFQALGRLY